MGGRSSSESKQQTENRQINAAVDDVENSNVVTNSGSNVSITTTDFGAIEAAENVSKEAFWAVVESTERAFETVESSTNASLSSMASVKRTADTGGQLVVAETLEAVFKPLGYGLLLFVVVVIVYMLRKGAKRV